MCGARCLSRANFVFANRTTCSWAPFLSHSLSLVPPHSFPSAHHSASCVLCSLSTPRLSFCFSPFYPLSSPPLILSLLFLYVHIRIPLRYTRDNRCSVKYKKISKNKKKPLHRFIASHFELMPFDRRANNCLIY